MMATRTHVTHGMLFVTFQKAGTGGDSLSIILAYENNEWDLNKAYGYKASNGKEWNRGSLVRDKER